MSPSGKDEGDMSYTDPRYWDSRYAATVGGGEVPTSGGVVFDWLCEASGVADAIRGLTSDNASGGPVVVLDLGCGNSQLAETIAGAREEANTQETRRPGRPTRSGCSFLIGTDYSTGGVLEVMSARMAALGLASRTDFLISDARWAGLREGVIDVVVDKGCLDSVLQDYDQALLDLQVRLAMRWKRSTARQADSLPELEDGARNAKLLLEKAHRMLAPGGVYLMVSYEPPAGRQEFLQAVGWAVETMGHVDDRGNYWYTCRKRGGAVRPEAEERRQVGTVGDTMLDELD